MVQCAQCLDRLPAEIIVGLHEANAVGALFVAEKIEQLNELKLIDEIVLEPQLDTLVLRMVAHRGIAFAKYSTCSGGISNMFRKVLTADARKLGEREPAWHRSVMQDVAPRQQFGLDAGLAQPRRGAVTIGDDEPLDHAHPRPR